MAGPPPPPWGWRADTGYLPPANLWLPGEAMAPVGGFMYGPAPNPNVFFDMGDGPPGPIAPMQFGVAVAPVAPAAPIFVPTQPVFAPPIQPVQPVVFPAHICQIHRCPCDHCGCLGNGLVQRDWRPGFNNLIPSETTTIEVYWDVEEAWGENVVPSASTKFHIFQVDSTWTFGNLIKHLMMVRSARLGGDSEPKGWAVTEYTEKGGGAFSKGSIFEFGKGSGDKALNGVGWTKVRGQTLPSVKCQLHKVPE